ncbi:MAG: hypothetical protein KatS3mg017_0161 [Fimbriimonadales bacterium]|nr:MAG: hypothetical protein KatS3mg017_0161 [Fimbriimonadales bacterium]
MDQWNTSAIREEVFDTDGNLYFLGAYQVGIDNIAIAFGVSRFSEAQRLSSVPILFRRYEIPLYLSVLYIHPVQKFTAPEFAELDYPSLADIKVHTEEPSPIIRFELLSCELGTIFTAYLGGRLEWRHVDTRTLVGKVVESRFLLIFTEDVTVSVSDEEIIRYLESL